MKKTLQQVQSVSFQADKELIQSNVNPSAQVTGDYVLIYTKSLHQSIQSKLIQEIYPLIEIISEKKSNELKRQLDELVKEEEAIRSETNQDFAEEIKQVIHRLRNQMFNPADAQQINQEIERSWQDKSIQRKRRVLSN